MVYLLWYNHETHQYEHMELRTYGLDSNLILEEEMMVGTRDSSVEQKLKDIQQLVSMRKLEEAKEQLAVLETITSPDQPSLVKIRSIINRLESRTV